MEKLRQVLAQGDTVIFIGSGISMWSGLSSWSALIEELARFVEYQGLKADLIRSEAQKGDLLQAASYGFDKLTPQLISEFIKKICCYGIAQPHEIHRKIVSLGPRCYITTNYDNLIEESLRKWQSDQFFKPPITNRQLTSMGELVHARATNFIFKPHGDAADCESIILTREQYRKLLPNGELHVALESLKLLLASRPVVYLGFGLRDPDFIYLKDILANLYKGGSRDHYAIMADVSDTEIDFWRRNYGIHLVGYTTIERPDKTRDHAPLLSLLDTFLTKVPVPTIAPRFDPCNTDTVLALARYSAGLARSPKLPREFQLRVHAQDKKRSSHGFYSDLHKFDHSPVEIFLDGISERALLIGMPGAGKTYSLRRAVARLADKLGEVCLAEQFCEKEIVVPIFADLKLYQGDLTELVSQSLPKNFPLNEVIRHFKVKIFLDSFNEMPKEYWESGSYEADFTKFIDGIGNSSLIIGSRTNDGLDKLGIPVHFLDQIDDKDVTTELERLNIKIEGRFQREVHSLLQRPFYFQYIVSGAIRLPSEVHPKDFYQSLFKGLQKSFVTRFKEPFDLEKPLSLVAYDALNRGEEAFPLTEMLKILKSSVEASSIVDIDVRDISNWLVSASILIPHTGGRVAFVHQTVTEYLAAKELARLYQLSPHVLMEKLSLTRWDQALFLTLSLLSVEQSEFFLENAIKADFALALNAAKYIELGRDKVLARLLTEIPFRYESFSTSGREIDSAIASGLPITELHEPQIRSLIQCGNTLGAAAVNRLVSLKGAAVKDELLQMLFDCRNDFNFCCNGIASALKPYATDRDAKKIVNWADLIEQEMVPDIDDAVGGFTSGAADFLDEIDLSVIRHEFLPPETSSVIPKIRARILCNLLYKKKSTASLNFAGELLLRGIFEAAFPIHLISTNVKADCILSWDSFNTNHVRCLISNLEKTYKKWTLETLKDLCAARPDLATTVMQEAAKKIGIEKIILFHCISPTDLTPAFQGLAEFIEMSNEDRLKQSVDLLEGINFDWSDKEDLFSKLILLRDQRLIKALLGGTVPPMIANLGKIKIGPIEPWLEWLKSLAVNQDSAWFIYQIGGLFAQYLDHSGQHEFIAEFNKSNSDYRRLLLKYILPYFKELTIDVFSEDAISFMLADLNQTKVSQFTGNLIALTATEKFINERLLLILPDAKELLLDNLHKVLKVAGARHGRRYVFER
ncbi:MAG: SIR2 family protein [Candidatus Nitrotoga sp.]|nr:SIR2 family protein [Candidatus Nitrotoga sp.]